MYDFSSDSLVLYNVTTEVNSRDVTGFVSLQDGQFLPFKNSMTYGFSTEFQQGANYYLSGNLDTIYDNDKHKWSVVLDDLNANVLDMLSTPDGVIYMAGAFTKSGSGKVLNHIAQYNGLQWQALGVGVDGAVQAIAYGPAIDVNIANGP